MRQIGRGTDIVDRGNHGPCRGRRWAPSSLPGSERGTMPLSEEDYHKLDQIERALAREDPRFADRISVGRWRRRRAAGAAAVFALGLILLLIGLITTQYALAMGVILSVAALVGIVAALVVFFVAPHR